MAELTITRDDIRRALSMFLGYGGADAPVGDGSWGDFWDNTLTPKKRAEINDVGRSGLRQAYYPPPVGEGKVPHEWSWLKPVASLALAESQSAYPAPDRFAGLVSGFSGMPGNYRVAVIPEAQLRSMAEVAPKAGVPAYAAVRVDDTTSGRLQQGYEFLFYPTPSAVGALTYRYVVSPPDIFDDLEAGVEHPLGGALHAEMILQSCLAVAEQRIDEEQGVQYGRFMERLAASIEFDKRAAATDAAEPWPQDGEGTELGLTYNDIARQCGGAVANYGWDSAQWTHEQVNVIDSCIQGGCRRFYYPPGHRWSWMQPTQSIKVWPTVSLTVSVDSDVTVAGTSGATTLTATGGTPFSSAMVGEWVAITDIGAFEISSVTSTTVLVVASAFPSTFTSKTFSIGDASVKAAGNTLTATEDSFYPSMVGKDIVIIGIGTFKITGYLSITKVTIDGAPATVGNNFTIAANGDYVLPSDVGGIDGTLTFATDEQYNQIEIIGENQIRAARQREFGAAYPRKAAVRPKESTGSARQEHDLMLWPIPDDVYTLTYKFNLIPPRLTADNPNPLGGTVHAQTLLEACMAETEVRLRGQKGAHWDRFMEQLAASIKQDREAFVPDSVGLMHDPATMQRGIDPRSRVQTNAELTLNDVLYTGS